ncbi:MAG: hypothetical protein ABFE08_16275 [Armatimonadia bacterium]
MSDHDDVYEPDADPKNLFERHRASGEPLSQADVAAIIAAGLAGKDEFDMTGGGCYLHAPTFPDPDADTGSRDLPRPRDMATAAAFRDWLSGEVDWWCGENGLAPHGGGENLGDLYREFDVADVFSRIGVTAIPAYDEQTLYLVGPDAAWIAATGIELGGESETLWQDPLGSLRLDVPVNELHTYRDRLLRLAGEITAVLDRGEGL